MGNIDIICQITQITATFQQRAKGSFGTSFLYYAVKSAEQFEILRVGKKATQMQVIIKSVPG